jgi:hypothetical protein
MKGRFFCFMDRRGKRKRKRRWVSEWVDYVLRSMSIWDIKMLVLENTIAHQKKKKLTHVTKPIIIRETRSCHNHCLIKSMFDDCQATIWLCSLLCCFADICGSQHNF